MTRFPTKAEIDLWRAALVEVQPIAFPSHLEPVLARVRRRGANRLDLHGMPLQAAWARALAFIEEAYYDRRRNLEIITGRSGLIRREFPHWLATPAFRRFVSSYEELNGGGSYGIKLGLKKA